MSERKCDFSKPSGFENCVFNYFCQCYSQCIGLGKEFGNKQDICTEIVIDGDVNNLEYYDNLINDAIQYFESHNLLYKSGIKYYILLEDKSKVKLSWENIKSIQSEETKKLFWLLRKLIVDSIIKKLLKQNKLSRDDIKIYSVGSTKLTSDYDITLYGNTNYKVKIIKSFQKIFKTYFHEDSSIIFDTNIYGKAYITFDDKEYIGYTTKVACGQTFYYLNENPSGGGQLMWGLIKYLRDIRDSFGEHIYNDLFKFMNNKMPTFKILSYANKTLIYLRNKDPNDINYTSLFKREESFIDTYGKNTLVGIHDFISVLNFYGTETYFTRGAFIDTVVNSQMCSNKIEIPLSEVDYITSILENAGFFFIHHNKTKYALRVLNTLKLLINKFDKYKDVQSKFNKLQLLLNELETKIVKNSNIEIDYDSKYCHDWADSNEDEVNLFKCQKFDLFNILMNLVFGILKIYNTDQDDKSIPIFYNNYVIKSSEEFGITDVLPSPDKLTNVIFPSMQHGFSLTSLHKYS
jgi:hypothetical protein